MHKGTELNLQAIEDILTDHGAALSAQQIHAELESIPLRTLQYWLKRLVSEKRIVQEGAARATRYSLPRKYYYSRPVGYQNRQNNYGVREPEAIEIALSAAAKRVQDYVRQPLLKRKTVGYQHSFLDSYRPNVSHYLSTAEREHLHAIGKADAVEGEAGTHARQIMNRLLIDLSWNSSRLEGNTYSLLDTRRLLDFGEMSPKSNQLEAQMILNHKDAIEFLVDSADEISFDRYTVLNLHAALANNLLANRESEGCLRHIEVGIGRSSFLPLASPQLIAAYFDQILATAAAINDPFEQAFFVMVQLPYLQPFDDVNKRVSRLAANIPLITDNYSPLSFVEMPHKTYIEGVLGVYELNDISLLKAVFIWAYERSAERYVAVKQSLGEPDPFRLLYRSQLKTLVAEVIRQVMTRQQTLLHVECWAVENIERADIEAFRAMAEGELLGLHEGNFARYGVRPAEFARWQAIW